MRYKKEIKREGKRFYLPGPRTRGEVKKNTKQSDIKPVL
jgi:hypothetical protein